MWWGVLKVYLWLLSIHPLVFVVAAIAAGWFASWKWAVAILVFAFAIFGPIIFMPVLLPLLLRGVGWAVAKLDTLRPAEPST
jgi:hypothetical protein